MIRAIAIALLLAGCAGQPTANDLIGSSYATITVLADTAADLCAALEPGGECQGNLTTADRDRIKAQLIEAQQVIDQARAMSLLGDESQAMQQIQLARTLLAAVEATINAER